MKFNDRTLEISVSQYDYGVPIIFEAGKEQGFSIGDKIIFIFDSDKIEDKIFEVDAANYYFGLAFNKEEADTLFSNPIKSDKRVKYSAKRYKENEFLETLIDSKLIIKETLKWDGEW